MIDYIGIARKAVECDDMVKLLEGKGEYHCEFFYYGLVGIDITDWGSILSRGIYVLYNKGGYGYIPDAPQSMVRWCAGCCGVSAPRDRNVSTFPTPSANPLRFHFLILAHTHRPRRISFVLSSFFQFSKIS